MHVVPRDGETIRIPQLRIGRCPAQPIDCPDTVAAGQGQSRAEERPGGKEVSLQARNHAMHEVITLFRHGRLRQICQQPIGEPLQSFFLSQGDR